MLVDHLFVDAEKMFYPAVDFRRNASILNLLAYLRNYIGDKLIADFLFGVKALRKVFINFGLKIF